jgi:hypothetical protein
MEHYCAGSGLDQQFESYLGSSSPPLTSIESILRQAALRRCLDRSLTRECRMHLSYHFSPHSSIGERATETKKEEEKKEEKQEEKKEDKDPYGELDKFATTLDVTQGQGVVADGRWQPVLVGTDLGRVPRGQVSSTPWPDSLKASSLTVRK